MPFKLLHILIAACLAAPAMAGESAWTEIAPDARLRLISSDTIADGRMLAALEIDMPAGMKTYWRIPGETGIPVEIDMSRSRGAALAEIFWPYPLREYKDGFIDFVYYGHTILPFELEIHAENAEAAADVLMGVCTDICVPVRAQLALPLAAAPDPANALRIRQAMAETPLVQDSGQSPIGDVRILADKGRLAVTYDPALVDPRSIIVDTGDPAVLFSMPVPDAATNSVHFEPIGRTSIEAMSGAAISVTFLTGDGAYQVRRTATIADMDQHQ